MRHLRSCRMAIDAGFFFMTVTCQLSDDKMVIFGMNCMDIRYGFSCFGMGVIVYAAAKT